MRGKDRFSSLGTDYAKDQPHLEAAVQGLQGVEVEVTTPPAPNTEFAVPHNLRAVPNRFVVLRTDKGSMVYCSRRTEWDARRIFLKATVGSDTILLRLS